MTRYEQIQTALRRHQVRQRALRGRFRAGDVRHSQADIGKAQRLLGYAPQETCESGIRKTVAWYLVC